MVLSFELEPWHAVSPESMPSWVTLLSAVSVSLQAPGVSIFEKTAYQEPVLLRGHVHNPDRELFCRVEIFLRIDLDRRVKEKECSAL